MAIKHVANGDMLQYFADHPDKLKAKQERDAKKDKTKAFSIDEKLARLYARRNGLDYPMKTQALARLLSVANEEDAVDTISVDVPLFVRLLELAREDLKTDADLHVVVTKVIELSKKGSLSMADYPAIEAVMPQPAGD